MEFLNAAYRANLQLLKKLTAEIENGEWKVSYATLNTAEGCNALHLAAAEGKTQMCRYLIQKLKFDINAADRDGETPLFQAILGRHRPTTIFLIENGADVTKRNNKGFTPLHYAAEKGYKEFMKLLILKGAGSALPCAAAHGKSEAVKYLLELKAPNSISPVHLTPLMLSMLAESLDCMELLLEAGAYNTSLLCCC